MKNSVSNNSFFDLLLSPDFFDSFNHGVYLISDDMQIRTWNPAMENLTGFKREDVTGKDHKTIKYFAFMSASGEADFTLCMQENKNNEPRSFFIETRDGAFVPVILTGTPLIINEKKYTLITVIDVSRVNVCGAYTPQETIPDHFEGLIGKDAVMQRVFRLIESAADSHANVLISGESGTGKELTARAVHVRSARRNRPFVAVNCAAIAESILESELFGHVKGSFTGAYRDRIGKFEAANGGTVFLDEIGELPLSMQVKILRVIQERTIERVGDTALIPVDIRIIAATNRNLKDLMNTGGFREDLYYRLKVFPIVLPPLRTRKNDIPLLVTHFINKYRGRTVKKIQSASSDALRILMEYRWPGNVRELENAVEYAFAVCTEDIIHARDLPSELSPASSESIPHENTSVRKKFSNEDILRILDEHKGNRSAAARTMGISRISLWKKLKKINFNSQDLNTTGSDHKI